MHDSNLDTVLQVLTNIQSNSYLKLVYRMYFLQFSDFRLIMI